MSLKSQIETAKDAVSKALITALENKDEINVSKLITCYNNLSNIRITEPIKFDLTGGIYTNKYESYNIPCSMSDDVISFTGLG
jgi:hypothetical protein